MLRRDLIQALRKKRPGTPVHDFLLHQDKAPAHVSARTRLELSLLDLECISHPPYSPDLAPMDFAVFSQIKKHLKGRRFDNQHELTIATRSIIAQFDEEWYINIFDRWVHRHKRCIEERGQYFEKL